jgi:DNA (cytosine-5)-methyltransferase 1
LSNAVQNWPTPHANCSTGAGKHGEGGENLQTAVGVSLNPDWVEILMGFDIGWTDIDRNDLESWPGWPASRGLDQCAYEPPRVAKGGKNRAKRLRCLGNAVVPQQAYPIFRAIMEEEAK